NRAPDVTQWPEAVERLERRKRDQSQSKQPEARDKRCAHGADLKVQCLARLGDLKPPLGLAARKHDVALEHAQFLAGKLMAVVCVKLLVIVCVGGREPALPQRARGIGLLPPAADLPIKAAIGFEKALVAQR